MAKFGGGVDELELDLLQGRARGLGEERLPQRDAPLPAAGHCPLQDSDG